MFRLGVICAAVGLIGSFPLGAATGTSRTRVAQRVQEAYFGMHVHRAVPRPLEVTRTKWPQDAFGSWRLWDAGVSWAAIEPRRGRYDFALLDRYVELAESSRVEILLPLGLSPSWASARPREASAYGPGNASEPQRIEDWKNFVHRVACRYKGRIAAYEVWNEPNLKQFFSGSVIKMVRLTEVARNTIKECDPAAIIVSPAPTGRKGLSWLQEFFRRGGASFVDVVGYHFYVRQQDAPEKMTPLIRDVFAAMARQGVRGKQVWNTESGWRLSGRQTPPESWMARNPDTGGSLDSIQAEAAVCRAYLVGLVGRLDRFYWYSWDHYAMGLVEPDGVTEKPAAKALRTLRAWLVGATIDRVSTDGDVWCIYVRRSNGWAAAIVWSTGRTRAWHPRADWKFAQVHTVQGETLTPSGQIAVGSVPQLVDIVAAK